MRYIETLVGIDADDDWEIRNDGKALVGRIRDQYFTTIGLLASSPEAFDALAAAATRAAAALRAKAEQVCMVCGKPQDGEYTTAAGDRVGWCLTHVGEAAGIVTQLDDDHALMVRLRDAAATVHPDDLEDVNP